MRRCPKCESALYRKRVESIELDACPGCGGVWFDRGELQMLAREKPEALIRLDAAVASTQQPLGRATHACPACGSALESFLLPDHPGLALDGCRACRGVWMDRGEMAALGARRTDATAPPAGSEALARASAEEAYRQDPTRTAGLPLKRARTMPTPPQVESALGRMRLAWRFVKAAYQMGLRYKVLLVPVALQMLLMLGCLGTYYALLFLNAPLFQEKHIQDAWFRAHLPWALPLLLVVGLMIRFFNFYTLAMTISLVDAHLKGLPIRMGIAARDAFKNLGALLALTFFDLVVGIFIGLVRGSGRGGPLSLGRAAVARGMQVYWEALTFLLLPVILIEDLGFSRARARAQALYHGGFLPLAGGEIGLRLVAGLIALLVLLPSLGAFALAVRAGNIGGYIYAAVMASALLGTASVLNVFARAAYYTSLYLWTVERERQRSPQEPVPVPMPLAAALSPR